MKQKIKIMKNQPQPSDEEIQSYMNFDSLLVNRKTALTQYRVYSILKWGVPSLIFTGVMVWFLFFEKPDKRIISEESSEKNATPPASNVVAGPKVNVDSIAGMKANDKSVSIVRPERSKKTGVPAPTAPFSKEEIYIQAEPQNGYSNLYQYFAENLVYPSEAFADSIQGVQTISFIINRNGTPEKITITNSLGEPFEKEARRLIETMPAWKPATLNGRPVDSKVSLPLTFQIQKVKN